MRHFLLLLFGLFLVACGQQEPRVSLKEEAARKLRTPEQIAFRKDGTLTFIRADGTPIVTIDIEIAETDSARQRGLMQRTSMPPRSGMLFLFDREEPQSFWMANTPLSLDIIFVNADSQIVDIHRYAKPFSTEPITSAAPAKFVVEVPAGFVDQYGILEGDRIRWKRLSSSS